MKGVPFKIEKCAFLYIVLVFCCKTIAFSALKGYNRYKKSAPVILNGALFSCPEIKFFYNTFHHFPFGFKQTVYISVHCNYGAFMSENFGHGFNIRSAFQRTGGEGVPQNVKFAVFNLCFFQYSFIRCLIGTVGNVFALVG